MTYSKEAEKLRQLIDKAIEDHKITPEELDLIHSRAGADGIIDKHEQALLNQLHEMISDKSVKITR